MKNINKIALPLLLLVITILVSGYSTISANNINETLNTEENSKNQTINMFVTHGHCSTPFAGPVNDLKLVLPTRADLGNPVENLEISFSVNPNTLNVCAGEDLTAQIRTPGLFFNEANENITFKSTSIYTMGLDWYQLNGKLSIKGIEKEVKLFVTGIRRPQDSMPTVLIFEGQINLFDWGIDYNKIVNHKFDTAQTKMLHLNMKVKI